MPELEAPPLNEDGQRLASNFDKALAAVSDEESGYKNNVGEVPTKKEVVPEKPPEPKKEENSLIPAQFIDPTKKPEPAKTEVPEPLVDAAFKEGLKGKAREAFEKLETSARTRIEKMEAELAEARSKAATAATPAGPTQEHLDALKAANERAAKLEQDLERAAYERSPRFKKFGEESAEEIKTAKSYLEGTELSPGLVDAAAHASGAARIKILRDNGVDAETISAIAPHLARVDAIRRERDAALENWKSSMAQETEQYKARQAQQEANRAAEEKRVFTEMGEQMRKDNPAFTRVDGNDKWNAIVEQNLKDAEAFFAGNKPLPELAKLAYEGVSARTVRMMNGELTRMLNEAREENAKLKAAQPGTGKPATLTSAPKPEANDPRSAYDHHISSFDKAMAEMRGA